MKTTRVMMTADECGHMALHSQQESDGLQRQFVEDGELMTDLDVAALSDLLRRRDYFMARQAAVLAQEDD